MDTTRTAGRGKHPALGATRARSQPPQPSTCRWWSPSSRPWPDCCLLSGLAPGPPTVTLLHTCTPSVTRQHTLHDLQCGHSPGSTLCPSSSSPTCWLPWQTALGREHQGNFQNWPQESLPQTPCQKCHSPPTPQTPNLVNGHVTFVY